MRRCYLEPVAEVWRAAEMLGEAVRMHHAGKRDVAASLFRDSDFEKIGTWFRTVVGPYNPAIHGKLPAVLDPPRLAPVDRKRPRMPSGETKRQVLARDGMHCRFCDGPVIPKEIIRSISASYPADARWSDVASQQHRMFQAMSLQYDHVLPHARGGDSSFENVVIACAVCNYGRMSYTPQEAGLFDPRTQPIRVSEWDGLTAFLKA
jgi:5-methylcytosine-specific restriction endonuclease McrA